MSRAPKLLPYLAVFAAGVLVGIVWPDATPPGTASPPVPPAGVAGPAVSVTAPGPVPADTGPDASALAADALTPAPAPGVAAAPPPAAVADPAPPGPEEPALDDTPPPTPETALARFHDFLDLTAGTSPRERRRLGRAFVDELRAMGGAGTTALLRALREGEPVRDRRAAATFLGRLGDPAALAPLEDVVHEDPDLLLRRTAARSLRMLETPETIPAFESILDEPGGDPFVRFNAAYGLARLGEPRGVEALVGLYEEAAADGRGRFLAFRVLASLDDPGALPLMRRVAVSGEDVYLRQSALQFVGRHGTAEDLELMQRTIAAPGAEPSLVEAAQAALANLSRRRPAP